VEIISINFCRKKSLKKLNQKKRIDVEYVVYNPPFLDKGKPTYLHNFGEGKIEMNYVNLNP
jgi:tRNA1(Val) A37 N6-methylase TrmN6